MSSQNIIKFPFEFRSLQPQEVAEVKKHFAVAVEFVRVGSKGYLLSTKFKDDAENIYNMPLKSDDVFVCGYPRSGTTWTQELVWLINRDLDYEAARLTSLTRRYIFLEFSSIYNTKIIDNMVEFNKTKGIQVDAELLDKFSKPGSELLMSCPSPRFIKTHLPMSFLPPRTIDTVKVVYVARDPRDVAVSFFYFNKMSKAVSYNGEFKTYWNFFIKNLLLWTPYFEHLKEAWAVRHHPNMLFLFYEELSKDYSANIRRVANFFGKHLSEEQIAGLCDYLSFENFKKNDSVNNSELVRVGAVETSALFIRKGKAGGWREYFDEEMTQQAERWIEDNLRGTDLRFPHLN